MLETSAQAPKKGAALMLHSFRKTIDVIAILLFCYMILAILVQIFGRYLFNYSIAGTDETATFAMIWLTMIGTGIAMRSNQHVGVDFLVLAMPRVVQLILGVITFALAAWFLASVAIAAMQLVEIGLKIKSPAARLPMALPYGALVFGFFYFLLEFAIYTLPRLFALTKPEAN